MSLLLIYVLVLIIGVTLTDFLVFIFSLVILRKPKKPKATPNEPFVSVLLAVRNEAENLERCMESLLRQDYPKEKYEILIGDDDSEDQTLAILKAIQKEHSNIFISTIEPELRPELKGKARVLEILASKARGEILLMTDADMQLPDTWLSTMVSYFSQSSRIGMVTGCTVVHQSKFQTFEWLLIQGICALMQTLGRPVGAKGNNMAVRKKAYFETGGYNKIPFSVTEDIALHHAILLKGWKSMQLMAPEAKGITLKTQGFKQFFQQRKRWIYGATFLPLPLFLLLMARALFLPALVVLLLFLPVYGVVFFLIRILLLGINGGIFLKMVAPSGRFPIYFLEAAGHIIADTIGFLYFILPSPVVWKKRKYY